MYRRFVSVIALVISVAHAHNDPMSPATAAASSASKPYETFTTAEEFKRAYIAEQTRLDRAAALGEATINREANDAAFDHLWLIEKLDQILNQFQAGDLICLDLTGVLCDAEGNVFSDAADFFKQIQVRGLSAIACTARPFSPSTTYYDESLKKAGIDLSLTLPPSCKPLFEAPPPVPENIIATIEELNIRLKDRVVQLEKEDKELGQDVFFTWLMNMLAHLYINLDAIVQQRQTYLDAPVMPKNMDTFYDVILNSKSYYPEGAMQKVSGPIVAPAMPRNFFPYAVTQKGLVASIPFNELLDKITLAYFTLMQHDSIEEDDFFRTMLLWGPGAYTRRLTPSGILFGDHMKFANGCSYDKHQIIAELLIKLHDPSIKRVFLLDAVLGEAAAITTLNKMGIFPDKSFYGIYLGNIESLRKVTTLPAPKKKVVITLITDDEATRDPRLLPPPDIIAKPDGTGGKVFANTINRPSSLLSLSAPTKSQFLKVPNSRNLSEKAVYPKT